MRFIDLFAGLGGFHLALADLGHGCVFASESDETLREVYHLNFGILPSGDIKKIDATEIPAHDILCAGFPCQPFSKAGYQDGFWDPVDGNLFSDLVRIAHFHRPEYLLLENVPNLQRHDRGRTWSEILRCLEQEGYEIAYRKYSPHQFGIPQIRERLYIVGKLGSLSGFEWPEPPSTPPVLSMRKFLGEAPADARTIPEQVSRCITVWQEFLDLFPAEKKLPSFPIWSMEFGATYPYEESTPHSTPLMELTRYAGSHGQPLTGRTRREVTQMLPSHARTRETRFPDWKIRFIRQNRKLYEQNRTWIDCWIKKILEFPSSFQKLEWNCQGEVRVLRNFVLQARASGIRVKRPTTAPSLVAMTSTQVPIIGWQERYMTPRECQSLQSMGALVFLPDTATKAYQALGNAVNVDVARLVASQLIGNSAIRASDGLGTTRSSSVEASG